MHPEAQNRIPGHRRLWRLLPGRFRLWAGALLAGTVLGAGLEVLGLSLLATLMAVITPGGSAPGSTWLQSLARGFHAGGSGDALRLVGLTAAAFVAKNLFMGGVAWLEASFAFRLQSYIANQALAATLRRSYEDVTRRSPSEYLNLITADLTVVIFHLALPALTFVSEALLMLGVVGFLLWAEPGLTAAVVVAVGTAAWVVMRWSRRAMGAVGRRRQVLEDERLHRLREIFEHLREVYVYRAALQAGGQLQSTMGELARVYRAYQMMATGPRFLLEIILMAVLLTAILLGLQQQERQSLIVGVGIFAASGFRLLIGANRLIMSAQGIRYAQPAMGRMLAAMEEPAASPALPAAATGARAEPMSLALRDVRYAYAAGAQPVLDGVDLEIRRGAMVGIRGGSGGGKTTLLELLAGLRRPASGAVLLDGQAMADGAGALFHIVGYVGQNAAVFSDTIRRNVAYGYADAAIDDARVWAALEKARLADYVRALPGGLDFALGGSAPNLSGGQAQRLALARALYARCFFLLLDEPTSALDPQTEEDVVETLMDLRGDYGILLVSHRPMPLERCDAVYEMREGRLAPA